MIANPSIWNCMDRPGGKKGKGSAGSINQKQTAGRYFFWKEVPCAA
jgi:hypothetical protein